MESESNDSEPPRKKVRLERSKRPRKKRKNPDYVYEGELEEGNSSTDDGLNWRRTCDSRRVSIKCSWGDLCSQQYRPIFTCSHPDCEEAIHDECTKEGRCPEHHGKPDIRKEDSCEFGNACKKDTTANPDCSCAAEGCNEHIHKICAKKLGQTIDKKTDVIYNTLYFINHCNLFSFY